MKNKYTPTKEFLKDIGFKSPLEARSAYWRIDFDSSNCLVYWEDREVFKLTLAGTTINDVVSGYTTGIIFYCDNQLKLFVEFLFKNIKTPTL